MRKTNLNREKTIFTALSIAVFLYLSISVVAMFFGGKIPYGIQVETVLDAASSGEHTKPIGEIQKGDIVQQSFTLESKIPIHSIQIDGAAYARENKGLLDFRLIDANGICLKNWQIDMAKMVDNEPVILGIEELGLIMARETYLLEIVCKEGQAGSTATLYASLDKISPAGRFTINGREQPGNLCFRVMGMISRRSFLQTKFWLYVYAAAFVELVLFLVYRKCKNAKRV